METVEQYRVLILMKPSQVQQKVEEICEKNSIASHVISDVQDALEEMMDTRFDCIVFDTAIGGSSMIDTIDMISSDIIYREIPIIIISERYECDNEMASRLAEFNVLSIFSCQSWSYPFETLLTFLRDQGRKIQVLENELTESEVRNVIDPLTGTLNRFGAEDKFHILTSQNKAYEEPFSLLLFDIDHFKSVNDTYGHDMGDEVLVSISSLIRQSIRKRDALIRLGGEEFVVFLSGADLPMAIEMAESLRKKIESIPHTAKALSITASFGVVEYTRNESLKRLIKRADECVYEAKSTGRNRVVASKKQ